MPRSSSSSEKFSSPDSRERRLLERLEKERIKLKEKKRKEKELLKATESLEDKRMRRMMKKEMKERKRKERMGWDNDYLHYTNTDNPFGDSNLLSTFVWGKKLAKEGLTEVTREEIEAQNRLKMEENKRELEKVKKRRLERELERQRREEEMSRLQRSKEATQFQEWEQQEDEFHLDQARLRSQIRIHDGRAKPIDLLAKYIGSEKELDVVEVHEPYTYLSGLSINDLEDLVVDIKVYTELEKGKNLDYWNDITLIVQDELQKLRKNEMEKKNDRPMFRDSINPSVSTDIVTVFKGKTTEQLEEIQKQISRKISSSGEGTDLSYWESLLSLLKAHMARVRLRDRHQKNLKDKLKYLKQEQKVAEADSRTANRHSSNDANGNKSSSGYKNSKSKSDDENYIISKEYENELIENAKSAAYEILSEELDEYRTGMYSPEYISTDELEPAAIVVTEEDDVKRLEFDRLQVLGNGSTAIDSLSAEEKRLHNEARKGMTNEEAEFSVESVLDNQLYLWSDKYRPRKPRYFNRVHTGFEWNKYNQTHYDMDNPPPKIVQGYKFNIFYPDLINKSVTPEYFLIPCKDNPDFAILRFQAGPPYEDIAFKIVHREWEYSYKKGFRCQFHNNIFQLWFHFKRYRYRR